MNTIIKKGTEISIVHIVGETVNDVAKKLASGKWLFIKDAYVDGERGKGGYYHLRQAKELISGKKLGNNYKQWPRLRAACHKAGVRLINIPGGNVPIHYEDEMVIPDYKMSGAHFFIIKKSEVGKLLLFVPIDEAAEARRKSLADEARRKKEDENRQKYSPKGRCQRLGDMFWNGKSEKGVKGFFMRNGELSGSEFIVFTFEGWDGEKVSIAYNCEDTDLGNNYSNIAKILVPGHEGLNLRGDVAGSIDPREFYRLAKYYVHGWSRDVWVLGANPKMFTHVMVSPARWLNLFDQFGEDRVVDCKTIAYAKSITRSLYSLTDKLVYEDAFLVSELLDE